MLSVVVIGFRSFVALLVSFRSNAVGCCVRLAIVSRFVTPNVASVGDLVYVASLFFGAYFVAFSNQPNGSLVCVAWY
jgi:hypothetical protein